MEDFSKYNGEGTPLRKAQLCMLNILIEIDKICRKHDIPYWLDSGTLLGAVRHGGFIPWDDDMDICVLQKDYPLLQKFLVEELPQRYQLSDTQNDPYAFGLTPRVKDTFTYCNYPLFEKQNSQGLWVDILLQIPAVPTWYKKRIEKIYARVFREIHHYAESQGKSRWVCMFKTTLAYLAYPLALLLTWFGDSWAKKHYHGELMHTWDVYHGSRRYEQEIFPLSEIDFEGKSFYVPHNVDAYLRRIYGDYMKIPDESHRQIHMDVNSLKFFNTTPS